MKKKVYSKILIVVLMVTLTFVFSVPAMAESSADEGQTPVSKVTEPVGEETPETSGTETSDPEDSDASQTYTDGQDDDPADSHSNGTAQIENDVKNALDESDAQGGDDNSGDTTGEIQKQVKTKIKGAFKNIKVLKYSSVKPKENVIINHGVGRTVYLEKKNKGSWNVVRKYKAAKKDSSKKIKIDFSTNDYKSKTINWRIRVPETVVKKKKVVNGKVVVKEIKYKKAVKKAKTVVSKFAWPVPGHRWITSGFGGRICPFHGSEFHPAVDIAASKGTKVRAAADGVVVKASYHFSLGYHIVISHSNGKKVTTWYNHLSKMKVKKGQKVKRGQFIGRVGSTGSSTGPHLDFRIFINGKAKNPLKYAKKK